MQMIFDWDDTLQALPKIHSSFDMFFKTIFTSCESDIIKEIFKNPNNKIITTRPIITTYAIKLKCFMITKDTSVLSNTRITTINPNFFFNGSSKKRFSKDYQKHLEFIGKLKINRSVLDDAFNQIFHKNICYIDSDLKKVIYADTGN